MCVPRPSCHAEENKIIPFIHPTIHSSTHPSICPSTHPSIHLSVHPPMHSPIRPTIRASIHPSSIPALRKQGRCSHLSTGPEKLCSSHLNSFLPLADVLLAHVEPPHGPLSVPQVVLPLTGVDVPRGVAARTQALLFFFLFFCKRRSCRRLPSDASTHHLTPQPPFLLCTHSPSYHEVLSLL